MRRLGTRLVVMVVVLGIGWVGYMISDVTECDGPKADAWAEAYLARAEEWENDYWEWDDYTTSAQFTAYASRAEARYHAQLESDYPQCLENMNKEAAEVFYFDWKTYQAASVDNWQQAASYEEDMLEAMDAFLIEFDRLAVEYEWETN